MLSPRHRDGVYGEVIDQSGGFEREMRERGPDELNGRGLMIVDALSRRWGSTKARRTCGSSSEALAIF
jgi:hypothetical protein